MKTAAKVKFVDLNNGKHMFEMYINDRFAFSLPIQEAIELLDAEQYACFQAGQMEFFMKLTKLQKVNETN